MAATTAAAPLRTMTPIAMASTAQIPVKIAVPAITLASVIPEIGNA